MTAARKYLRDLQMAHFKIPETLAHLPDEIRTSPDFADYRKRLEEKRSDRVTFQQRPSMAIFLELMQEEVMACCRRCNIAIDHITPPVLGSIGTSHINARIINVPDSTEKLIVFDDGQLVFLNKVTRTLLFGLSPQVLNGAIDDFSVSDDTFEGKEPAMLYAASLFGSYLLFGDPDKHDTPSPHADWLMDVELPTRMCATMEIFIMGHEWGHLIGGHLDRASTVQFKVADKVVEMFQQNYEDEFYADHLAVRICADHLRNQQYSLSMMAFIDLYFLYMDTLERCMSTIYKGVDEPFPSTTHPFSRQRAKAVEEWMVNNEPAVVIDKYRRLRTELEKLAKPHLDFSVSILANARKLAVGYIRAKLDL